MAAIETRTFKDGKGVAVRLPEELGFFANMAVTIERVGDELWVKPIKPHPVEEKRKLDRLVAALRALGPVGEIGPR